MRLGGWIAAAVPLLVLAGVLALRALDPAPLVQLRRTVFDTYQVIKPRPHDVRTSPVRIVAIDDESLRRLGQWPWPRSILAKLVQTLHQGGAIAVAFDVIFAEEDRFSPLRILNHLPDSPALAALKAKISANMDTDAQFAAAMKLGRTVTAFALVPRPTEARPTLKAGFGYGGYNPAPFVFGFRGAIPTIPILTQAAAGNGAVNWVVDKDQILRRIPVLLRIASTFYPTFFAEVLRVGVNAGGYKIRTTSASGESSFGTRTGITAIQVGQATVPTDANGRMLLYFAAHGGARYIPAWKIIAGEVPAAEIRNRVFLVDATAPGLLDLRATPLGAGVPGVEVHAQAIEQVVAGAYLLRPDYVGAIEWVVVALLGLAMVILLPRLRAAVAISVFLPLLALIMFGAWYLFDNHRLMVDGLYPTIALALVFVSSTFMSFLQAELQRNRVRNAFGRYLAPALVRRLSENSDQLKLGGEDRVMTVLFSDIRGFTAISERFNARELTTFLNAYLTPLTETILDHGGTVDKYIGDAIMAFWNAPLDDPDHAVHACTAALEMAAAVNRLQSELAIPEGPEAQPKLTLRSGFGINTGECVVGNFGSMHRFDYSVLGDEVNLASRLEGLTRIYGPAIIIGERTREMAPEFAALELDRVRVKGKARTSRIFALVGDRACAATESFQELSAAHDRLLKAYRCQQWAAARDASKACEAMAPEIVADYYTNMLDRIAGLEVAPPAQDWDGSWSMLEK